MDRQAGDDWHHWAAGRGGRDWQGALLSIYVWMQVDYLDTGSVIVTTALLSGASTSWARQ